MKRIAIITPCILPVPALKGGAIEELISRIVRDNEERQQLNIDLFTISLGKNSEKIRAGFSYTEVFEIEQGKISV